MKNSKTNLAMLLLCTVCFLTGAYAQLTPSGDAYTNTADPTTNYGAKTLLDVESASQTTYIQFDLSSIPSGYTSASITKATLKLYVNSVTTAGSFNVDFVNGSWSEGKITANNAPALGTTIAASVPLTTANKNQYILIDITSALGDWLNGSQANDGIALVGNSPLNATFDSKESTSTSHSAELDIVFAGGGTITGVTTASGSGLIGGGASGTLNLSLTNACAAKQILQWNGSAWACASAGTGTITGVTAGTDLTGGGASGSVTLNVDTTKIPQLGAANTFTGNQAITGNLSDTGNISSTGSITGQTSSFSGNNSSQIVNVTQGGTGYAVLINSTTSNAPALAASSEGAAGVGLEGYGGSGVVGVGTGTATGDYGVFGWETGTTGITYGVNGVSKSQSGYGVYGNGGFVGVYGTGIYGVEGVSATVGGPGVYGIASAAGSEGVFGVESATSGTNYGVSGQNASADGAGVNGVSTSAQGTGVLGQAPGSTLSGTGSVAVGTGAVGIWGDADAPAATGVGVLGTTDDNYAVAAINNGTAFQPTIYAANNTTTAGGEAFFAWLPNLLNDAAAIIGDAGCASGYIALQLGQLAMTTDCTDYTLLGNESGDTYLNAASGRTLYLRIGNGSQMAVTNGNVDVLTTLTKPAGSFKIDHPLDPANKYLYHSFVESPDMKNMYDGNVTTNDAGLATVTLPDWFETLNRDFRYQLTVIGQFAQAIVASEISGNQFSIRTDKPGVKVSWQVTGTRQDAFANAHRIQVEVEKAPADRGRYLYPELVGAPETARIGYTAVPQGSEPAAHHRREMPRRGNAAPQPQPRSQRTPPPISVPPSPTLPKAPPSLHPAALVGTAEPGRK